MARKRTAILTLLAAATGLLATPTAAVGAAVTTSSVLSPAALVGLQHRIDTDKADLRTAGVDITGTRVLPESHKVDVWVRRLEPRTISALDARYGRSNLILEQQDYLHLMNRDNVGPPWPGGMTLQGSCVGSTDCLIAGCTAGFNAWQFIQGVRFHYMLTAGHCFTPNTPVTTGSNVPVGHVIQSWFASGSAADAEDILTSPGTQTPKIITSDPTQQVVQSAAPSQVTGVGVCKSGITTNETCGWTVSFVHENVSGCEDPPACTVIVTLVDQVVADNPTGVSINSGDSGGPVYSYVSGGVQAQGLVSTGNDTGTRMSYSFIQNILSVSSLFLCFDLGNGTC